MVTGDQYAIAVETCKRLGLGTNIMDGRELMGSKLDMGLAHRVDQVDGFAGVYPEDKHRIVEALQAEGRLVGMTGGQLNAGVVGVIAHYSAASPQQAAAASAGSHCRPLA